MLTGSLTLIIKQQPRCVQHFSAQAIPQDPALRSFQSYAVITARRTVKEGQGVCACERINAKDFLQQEKMREKCSCYRHIFVAYVFLFCYTASPFHFSGPHEPVGSCGSKGGKYHRMEPGRYSCHGARTDARSPVSGELQTAEK